MFKKGFQLFFISLLLLSGFGSVQAESFKAGTDYVVINTPVKTSHPDKVVVTEIFWYGCPHCYRFEPYIETWKKNLPEGVVFEQFPSVLNPRWIDHARTFFALQMMDELDRAGKPFFEALHVQRKRLNSVDTIAEFLKSQGVDEARFRQLFHSFPVDTLVRKSQNIESKYGHNGVPVVIINGKYRTGPSMAGSSARALQVMDYLVQKELAAK